MPTYQYRCTECGEDLEVVQKFSDEPLTVCLSCQGPLRKVFSPVGIVFKGSGFYRTDSRKGSTSPVSADKDKVATDSSKSDSSKSDSSSSTTSEKKSGSSASNGSSTAVKSSSEKVA